MKHPTRRQRGQMVLGLSEMAVVLGVLILLVGVGFGTSAGNRPGVVSGGSQTLASALDQTRELAATTGNGASLMIGPIGAGPFTVAVYPGRPNAAGLASAPSTTISINAALSSNFSGCGASSCTLGIYVNSTGAGSWAKWTTTPMATEPPCVEASPLVLTITNGNLASSATVRCDDVRAANS